MNYLDLNFAEPAMNLACDEWMLETAEAGQGELFRLWESPVYFVVLGRAKRIAEEVNLAACAEAGVPILRRASGGGTVLQGPGCLNYSLALSIQGRRLATLRAAFTVVLQRHRELLSQSFGATAECRGISDLAVGDRKISGNAQYRRRHFALVHGTILLDFDIAKCEKFLPIPDDRPAYRGNRKHQDFLANIGINGEVVRRELRKTWDAATDFSWTPSSEAIRTIAKARYSDPAWTNKF